MEIELTSVTKPTGKEADLAKSAPVVELSTSPPTPGAIAVDAIVTNTVSIGTKKRLVVGKSDKPIVPSFVAHTILSARDERTRIRETHESPWRMICALAIDSPQGGFVGTGWLAGTRTIITAGHCVYDANQMGGWAKTIQITPGRDDDDQPYGTITSNNFSTVDLWQSKQDPDYDIAAIHLAEPVAGLSEWFVVKSMSDDQLQNYLVNISGYPM
jgi:glutamyl endopeptidase